MWAEEMIIQQKKNYSNDSIWLDSNKESHRKKLMLNGGCQDQCQEVYTWNVLILTWSMSAKPVPAEFLQRRPTIRSNAEVDGQSGSLALFHRSEAVPIHWGKETNHMWTDEDITQSAMSTPTLSLEWSFHSASSYRHECCSTHRWSIN